MSSRAEASQARATSARVGEVHEEQWKKKIFRARRDAWKLWKLLKTEQVNIKYVCHH